MDFIGTNNSETLVGTNGDDTLSGLGGNDILKGKGGNDTLLGGNGKDILRGGAGDNFFAGGKGNDTYILTGRFETVEFGLGTDLIDLGDFALGEGFLIIQPHAEAKGVIAIIDGEEDFGIIHVDNGAQPDGLVLINDLNNALQVDSTKPQGAMLISGTDYDDMFMIDTGASGFIIVRPGEGNDLIQIEGTNGGVRLDYSDLNGGIIANLKFGIIIKVGGAGGIDRIVGEGQANSIHGTFFDDIIYGNRDNNSFTLRQGDDFVAGGGGDDTIRYDRSGVEAVSVDLSKNTATGIWNGESFTHTLMSIENIRGSRDYNDTLIGNYKDNKIDGKGGNDTIQGKGGNDTLIGGEGFDRFIFRNNDGNDTIADFNALSSKEKINLKNVSEITSFNDLMASHVTEFSGVDYVRTVIDDGVGLTITLEGVNLADLDKSDFIF